MSAFAKIFHSKKYGQIVVLLQTDKNNETPEVQFLCKPANMHVCAITLGFKDDSEGAFKQARELFDTTDLARAENMAESVFEFSAEFNGGVTCQS